MGCSFSTVRVGPVEAAQVALVFIKPHANTPEVQAEVKRMPQSAGISIISESSVDGPTIEKRGLIDNHYHAIASKAVLQKPTELNVPHATFKEFFQEEWSDVTEEGRAFNAIDVQAHLGIDEKRLDDLWSEARRQNRVVKLGGGFQCITNIIQAVLEDAGVPHDSSTLTISSNRLVFDKELNIRAVEPSPPVTSYNKAQTVERNRDWFNSACDAGRKTLLVIGDRISDLEVARGAAGAGAAIDHKLNVASIGIFNDTPHGPQIVLEDFASHFDAVIIGDNSSLEPVRKLVEVDLALAPHLTSRPDAPRAT